MNLDETVESSVRTLRGWAAVKGVENTDDARRALTRFDSAAPVALSLARNHAKSVLGKALFARLLPPFSDEERTIGEKIVQTIEANRKKKRR